MLSFGLLNLPSLLPANCGKAGNACESTSATRHVGIAARVDPAGMHGLPSLHSSRRNHQMMGIALASEEMEDYAAPGLICCFFSCKDRSP